MNVPSWLPLERREYDVRKTSRADVRIEIDMSSEHNFWWGLAGDIEEGGIFIATHRLFAVGERLFVNFRIGDGGEPTVALMEVAWQRENTSGEGPPPGLGLRFRLVDAAALARVKAFTARRDPLFFDT